jgi:hypothetical protein
MPAVLGRQSHTATAPIRPNLPAVTVAINPTIQQVGQPRRATMPTGTSSRAAGPTLDARARAAPISPKPSAPRRRWRASEGLASASPWSSSIWGSIDRSHPLASQLSSQRLAPTMQTRLHCGTAQAQCLCSGRSGQTLDVTHDQNRALLGRKANDGLDDSFELEILDHGIFGGGLDSSIRDGLRLQGRPVEGDSRPADALITHDPEHP